MGVAHMVSLARFAAEALNNTREHGTTDSAGAGIDGLRFLLMRRLSLVQEGTSAELRSESARLDGYLAAAREWLGARATQTPLMEVTVADSGIGIVGRFKTPEAYSGPVETEIEAVMEAVEPRTTSKPGSPPGAGMGLDKMLTSTRQLGGLMVIRSGRLDLCYDGLASRRAQNAVWTHEVRAFAPGTAVSALFPWHDRTQLNFDVENR
jgi:hypothetical protein